MLTYSVLIALIGVSCAAPKLKFTAWFEMEQAMSVEKVQPVVPLEDGLARTEFQDIETEWSLFKQSFGNCVL